MELARDGTVEVLDLGEHRLKDLGQPERIFQVVHADLELVFPPLRSLDAFTTNLPTQRTSFVGRHAELAAVKDALDSARLVTLTGVGGVGKTRLAVQTAAEVVAEYPDGVWLVELATVGDPDAVPDAVATTVGLVPKAGLTVTASIAEALAGRRSLLVFDNCEHVLDAAADLVEAILARPGPLKVLATSREGLRLEDERLWPVPSLGDRDRSDDAIALFVDRARAVSPDFVLDRPDTADAVAEICRRLDGIPLAIELAAARTIAMSAPELRDRLDDRFRLLSGSRRGLERHQTLRHAVQWSYDLLDDDERALLDRCAMFAGGFDLAAVAAINGADALDEYAVLDLLDALVRKSLVVADRTSGHTRYSLLETIRQFAEERLARRTTSPRSGRDTLGTTRTSLPSCSRCWVHRASSTDSPGFASSSQSPRRVPGRRRRRRPRHEYDDRRGHRGVLQLPRHLRAGVVGRGAARRCSRSRPSSAGVALLRREQLRLHGPQRRRGAIRGRGSRAPRRSAIRADSVRNGDRGRGPGVPPYRPPGGVGRVLPGLDRSRSRCTRVRGCDPHRGPRILGPVRRGDRPRWRGRRGAPRPPGPR